MKFCDKCQKEYPYDVKFCAICGQPLSVQEESTSANGALSVVAAPEMPAKAEQLAKKLEMPTPTDAASPAEQADIEVERTSSLFAAFFYKMRILVDGQEMGRLGNGDKIRFKVPPGIHEIRVKMTLLGGSSRPLSFQVKSGEFKRFRAGKTFGGFSMFTGFWMFKFIFSGGKIWKVEDY